MRSPRNRKPMTAAHSGMEKAITAAWPDGISITA
jgi:hypothetical protein